MNKLTRITAMLLMLCMVVLSVVACDGSGSDESSFVPTTTDDTLFQNLPEKNFEGAEVNILVPGDWRESYKSFEIMKQESNPKNINDAIQTRNALVENRFGVKITETRTDSTQTMITRIRNVIMSNLPTYDIVTPSIPDAAMLSLEDSFHLLNDMQYIDLKAPCWDQNALESLSINHKNYFVTGDMNLLAFACTHAIVFNKNIVEKNGLDDPYTLVNENKWTIDKLQEMARLVTADVDGVDGMSHKDRYGFLINSNFVTSMYVGSGHKLTSKDANDLPTIEIIKDANAAASIFTKIFELVNDQTATGQIDNTSGSYYASAKAANISEWTAATESVANELALFRAMSIMDIVDLGTYDCSFGIIPIPKYSENQDEYYSLVSTVLATGAAIPVSAADPEMSAIVLQAMCEASTDTTKYEYIQTVLKGRKIQDYESEAMLDKIFNERVYDLGIVYNWGGESVWDTNSIGSFMNTVAFSGTQTFASTLSSIQSVVQADLDKTLDQFNKKG